jgi:hypothetical protein
MLSQLPLQEAGAHLLAGDLPAAASALQRGTPPLSAPIVDEFRSPVLQAWVAFLQGDLVSARAALDRLRTRYAHGHRLRGRRFLVPARRRTRAPRRIPQRRRSRRRGLLRSPRGESRRTRRADAARTPVTE